MRKAMNFLIVVVTSIWVISFYKDVTDPTYDARDVNSIMLLLTGGAFAMYGHLSEIDQKRNSDDDENKKPPARKK